MKKRVLILVLAILLAFSLLPASAAAQNGITGRLVVNDVDVLNAPDPADVLGDGTVSFDMDTGILTLTNANLTKGVSDPSQDFAEHPAILFNGQLTIRLRGSSTIGTGTDKVMGQALRNSAIVGDELTITAETGASLTAKGMIQVNDYTQTGGSVAFEMENDHSRITKWAMYVKERLCITGGTLTAASTGSKRGGAIATETKDIIVAEGATLTEGNNGYDKTVSALTFSGVELFTSKNYVKIAVPESAQPQNLAYESSQNIELDGKTVRLQAYALKDAAGNPTNYVRLRDFAALLDGTAAQFDVLWDAESGITVVPRHPYDHPNGSEGNVPFSGDRPYTDYTKPTRVGDELKTLAAFQITDDNGGGHTYYQLRDLGRALDFNVGWSGTRGIYIEPDVPYTDAD